MDHLDFGKYLSQQRQLRGMSLEDVAKETKISESLLLALESGQMERLPGRIFVLNYVRAYAQVIGLNPEETALRFEEVDRSVQASPPPEQLEKQRRKKAFIQLALLLLALAAGAAAFVWFNAPPGHRPH